MTWPRRTVNLGEDLRSRVLRRAGSTGRSLAAELRFLSVVGLSLLFPPGIEGATQRGSLSSLPREEPERRTSRTSISAPPYLWEALEALAARCAWLRTPPERAWRGGPLLLRGRPEHVSRALRIAVSVGLSAVERRPSLDPAPARLRKYAAALREAYGDWDVKPEEPDWGSLLPEDSAP